MNALLDAGYPYEIAGLAFYVFFLAMVRKSTKGRYAQHTRVLTILAAIGLVGVVPFHYGRNPAIMTIVTLLAAASLVASFVDARSRA